MTVGYMGDGVTMGDGGWCDHMGDGDGVTVGYMGDGVTMGDGGWCDHMGDGDGVTVGYMGDRIGYEEIGDNVTTEDGVTMED